MAHARDHGGDLDRAIARHGGERTAWLDLSTGINPDPRPLPPIPPEAWAILPRRADMARLSAVAAAAYEAGPARIIAFAGAQGAIQAVPYLRPPGRAAVLSPTYNEHAAALAAAGWRVETPRGLDSLAGADLAVVVNPNNPDGRRTTPEALRALARRVGLLIVDESFVDPEPALSLLPGGIPENAAVLRSFGKFYGLAGARLGFALAGGALAERLSAMAGPWPVGGPTIEIAVAAFSDAPWRRRTIARLGAEAARLDALAAGAGWALVGGTPLFRTYEAPDAAAAQAGLARGRVWTRIFPYSARWIRIGLPPAARRAQLDAAFAGLDTPRPSLP